LRRVLGARAVELCELSQVRTVGIWVSGLLASAIIGFAIGAYFQRPNSPSGGALWGMLAALGIFSPAPASGWPGRPSHEARGISE